MTFSSLRKKPSFKIHSLSEFSENRLVYGTIGAIQKCFISSEVPEDFSIELLARTNMDVPMRAMEMMTDEPVYDLIYGLCKGYHKHKEQ